MMNMSKCLSILVAAHCLSVTAARASDAYSPAQVIRAARAEKQRHENEVDQGLGQQRSPWSRFSFKKYKATMERKLYHPQRKQERWDEMRNRFGEPYRFELANRITYCAATLIEKHYAGTASFMEGANYLREMQMMLRSDRDEHANLETLFQRCQDALTIYKKDKKDKKLIRIKTFDPEQMQFLSQGLEAMFPAQPKVVELLERAYSSEMDCHNPKGATLGFAFFVGGYGGMYRQKCRTPLGRRFKIYKAIGGANAGFGGGISTSVAGSMTSHPKVPLHSRPHRLIRNAHNLMVVGIGVGENVDIPVGAGMKVMQDEESARLNSSKVAVHISPSIGLGLYYGCGGGGEYKMAIRADFSELYEALEVYKNPFH